MLGISVVRTLRRNTNTTMITSPIEIAMVRCTSLTDARIVVVRSLRIIISIDAGIEAFSCGSTARMRSTVSTIFAPGCRLMNTITAGFRFTYPMLRRSSTESSHAGDIGQLHRGAVPVRHHQSA